MFAEALHPTQFVDCHRIGRLVAHHLDVGREVSHDVSLHRFSLVTLQGVKVVHRNKCLHIFGYESAHNGEFLLLLHLLADDRRAILKCERQVLATSNQFNYNPPDSACRLVCVLVEVRNIAFRIRLLLQHLGCSLVAFVDAVDDSQRNTDYIAQQVAGVRNHIGQVARDEVLLYGNRCFVTLVHNEQGVILVHLLVVVIKTADRIHVRDEVSLDRPSRTFNERRVCDVDAELEAECLVHDARVEDVAIAIRSEARESDDWDVLNREFTRVNDGIPANLEPLHDGRTAFHLVLAIVRDHLYLVRNVGKLDVVHERECGLNLRVVHRDDAIAIEPLRLLQRYVVDNRSLLRIASIHVVRIRVKCDTLLSHHEFTANLVLASQFVLFNTENVEAIPAHVSPTESINVGHLAVGITLILVNAVLHIVIGKSESERVFHILVAHRIL